MKKVVLILFIFTLPFLVNGQSNWAVGVGGGIVLPLGDFDDLYNSGYNGNVQVLYNFGTNTLLSVTVGVSNFNLDNDAVNRLAQSLGFDYNFDLDGSLRVIPFLIGAKWYFIEGNLRPFFQIEGGAYNYKSSVKGTVTDNSAKDNPGPIEIDEVSESGTETALSIGAGNFFKISKNLFVEIMAKYHVITNARPIQGPDDDQTINGVSRTIQYIGLIVGINYRF